MILAYVVLLSIIVGYVRGGRLARYEARPLRLILVPVLAFLIEAFYDRLAALFSLPTVQFLPWAVGAQYLLLLLFCLANLRRGGAIWILAGTLTNILVISLNGFRMPVSEAARDMPGMADLVLRIDSGQLAEYVIAGRDAPLWFLGDVIPLPLLPSGLASVGDLLLGVGVFLLIQHIMLPKQE